MNVDYKAILIKYINDGPYCFAKPQDWQAMSVGELLLMLDAQLDKEPYRTDGHSYTVIPIGSYEELCAYRPYAPDWCIIESEDAYDEHVQGGKRFYLLERDDMRSFRRKIFGAEYPYDNFGMSLIAVCVDERGHVVSVTSRWHFGSPELYDRYLTPPALEQLLGRRLEEFIPRRPVGIRSILHLSDTHARHRELTSLPMADIVVCTGDFTSDGSEEQALDFMNWLCDLPHPHKIFIAGNHDHCMYGYDVVEGLPDNVHYLYYNSVTIGGLKFHGVPLFMDDIANGTFQHQIHHIPTDTDVLLTHGPSYCVCDLADYGRGAEHRGDPELAREIAKLKLLYHLFGHEHDTYGLARIEGTTYSNAALADIHGNLARSPRLLHVDEDDRYHLSHLWPEE